MNDEDVFQCEEVAEFFGYLRDIRVDGDEVAFTIRSSNAGVFDLIKRSFQEEADYEFPDPCIWFKFKASRLA